MKPTRARPWWPALVLAALGLTTLYAEPLRTRFLNDDYIFLEEARTRPVHESLAGPGALGNYFRPLSREIYFALLTPIAGGRPEVFHAVNFAVFLVALALIFDLLRVLVPWPGAMAGSLYFALLPLQRVNLTWISCSQDLLASAGSLAAIGLYRRGRIAWAALAYAAALASKESALPLPAALVAWSVMIERRRLGEALRLTLPLTVLGLAWAAVAIGWRMSHVPSQFLRFDPTQLLAAYVHMVQSLLGLEQPQELIASLFRHAPPLLPLVLLGALALWLGRAGFEPEASSRPLPQRLGRFAAVWLLAFGFVTAPVAHIWSAYHYTLAAVGGAMVVGLAFQRVERWTWVALAAFLLWLHTGTSNTRTFAVAENPWGWTSHLSHFYFHRAAGFSDAMSRQLRGLEPSPPRDTRFYFATLPPAAGFQMGNGALIRDLYRDRSLQSYFYSEFSESTAAGFPCRFLYWDGARLTPLYANARDPFFQVGSDLLLLDRPAGAAHAFRRGIAAGEDRMDHLYWLGWAELWLGRRGSAEATWQAFGAVDDSLYHIAHLRAAHNALVDGDTLESRRHLIRSIEYGIGRPEGHAVLGELLLSRRPKYAMLELKVATWLQPRDWMALRALSLALVEARLDDPARGNLEALGKIYPEWESDSALVRARQTLELRLSVGIKVAQY